MKKVEEWGMSKAESVRAAGETVLELDRKYNIHNWCVQADWKALPVAGAKGCYFWDYEGKRYLDFGAQFVNANLGHGHPRLTAAIKQQADKYSFISPAMADEKRSELARLIAEVTPGHLIRSHFESTGSGANDEAIKLARWYTGRHKILARYRSYHGCTAGAQAITGDPRRWPSEPGIPGVIHILDPYTYRCPAGHPDPCPVCSGAPYLEEILQYEGPHTVAAIIMEPIVGTNGLIVPPDDYLRSVREVCDRYGIVLIFDEVQTGFGRTGRWFGCENWDVTPDIMTLGKGINSGYVPLGAMVVSEPISAWLNEHYFAHGGTYAGHPLACAAAVTSIEVLREEQLVERAAELGEYLSGELTRLAEGHPSVGDVRGLGLYWGLELVRDRRTKEPLVPFNPSGPAAQPAARLYDAAMERGLYIFVHWNMIYVTPPLVVTKEELDEGLGILDEVLLIADEYCSEPLDGLAER
jgi:taurine---2-oxoglutarate transaminase